MKVREFELLYSVKVAHAANRFICQFIYFYFLISVATKVHSCIHVNICYFLSYDNHLLVSTVPITLSKYKDERDVVPALKELTIY